MQQNNTTIIHIPHIEQLIPTTIKFIRRELESSQSKLIIHTNGHCVTDHLLKEFEKHGPYLFFENQKGGNFYIIDNPDSNPKKY